MKKTVYLDHNATTPLHPAVKKTMSEAMEIYGNPSSLHAFGRQAKKMVDIAREQVATIIGAKEHEILFTGSGTEANNAVLAMVPKLQQTEVITTVIEHPAILEPARDLEKQGIKVTYLKVDKLGKIDLNKLENSINENTGLVSVMMVNNEIGTIQDMQVIADIAHQHGALLHTDAIQAVGKIPIDVVAQGIDLLTMSGHKMYGPKGIGALYIKDKTPFEAFIRGGHQEQNRRAGTENSLAIAGLGKAVEMRGQEMQEEHGRLLKLKELLKNGIAEQIPDIHFNGHATDCVAGTLNVSFAGAEGEAILLYLDAQGIAVSTGSACASGSLDPSHVLLAVGASAEYAHGSIRISLGRENTKDDIEYTLQVLPKVIKKIRDMSSVYKQEKFYE